MSPEQAREPQGWRMGVVGRLLTPQWRSRLWFLVKLCVSLALLAYLGFLIDWRQAAGTLSRAFRPAILLAPLATATGLWISSVRWRLVLADNGARLPAWEAFRAYWLGLFYGLFLPGVLGGDAFRVALCIQRASCPAGTATASVLLERLGGILALLATGGGVYLLSPATTSSLLTGEDSRLVVVAAGLGILALAFSLLTRRLWIRLLPKEGTRGVLGFVRSGLLTLGMLRGQTLVLLLLFSIAAQAMNIVAIFLLSRATGLELPLLVFFAVVPWVFLATVLPISLGGLGVREGVLVLLLSRFGVSASEAVALSLLVYLNNVLVGALGGGLQLSETLRSRSDKPLRAGLDSAGEPRPSSGDVIRDA